MEYWSVAYEAFRVSSFALRVKVLQINRCNAGLATRTTEPATNERIHYSNTPSLQYSKPLVLNISQIKVFIQLMDQA
jgi:hypothetical protein